MQEFEVLVIGAGPGGYVSAIRASRNGAKTAIVEKNQLGGTCLNIGCIPTKTLLAGSEVLHQARRASEFGVKISGKIGFDWTAMLSRKDAITAKLRGGVGFLLKAAGVTVLQGAASFLTRHSVLVGNEEIKAKKIIIASGSESLVPGFVPRGERVITSTELLSIPEVPKSLLILGGGVIGCEFACLFNELGTKVTVVEMLESIIPNIDREVAKTLSASMKAAGIEILNGTPLSDIKASAKGVSGMVGDKKLEADYLLVSIGRKNCNEALNLGAAGVATDKRGWIPVDSHCRTNVAGIYAIGDTATKFQLAHVASAMGIVAADDACGKKAEFDSRFVPGCIFTSPEIGSVGMSSEQCAAAGIKVKVGKFQFANLGKAQAMIEPEGFCKIIADADTDQILGMHIIGPHATDLIAEAVPALKLECTARELAHSIHAHPTLPEAVMEAAYEVNGESTNVPAKRHA